MLRRKSAAALRRLTFLRQTWPAFIKQKVMGLLLRVSASTKVWGYHRHHVLLTVRSCCNRSDSESLSTHPAYSRENPLRIYALFKAAMSAEKETIMRIAERGA